MGKVKNTFLPHEAELILSTPISARLPEDSFIWSWIPNGRFTVKSTYKVAQKVLKEGVHRGEEGGNSDSKGMKGMEDCVVVELSKQNQTPTLESM